MAKQLKKIVLESCTQILLDKRQMAVQMVSTAESARNNETKSSAGDKYETGRAMMQRERDKAEAQLFQIEKQMAQLKTIQKLGDSDSVGQGSLVITNEGFYLIAISLGKVKLEDETYYVISPESPISKSIWGRKSGHKIQFQNREIEILKIY